MFKRDDLQSRFRIFLTGCRLFATIKILVMLLTTDLTSNQSQILLKMSFSNSIQLEMTKISTVYGSQEVINYKFNLV